MIAYFPLNSSKIPYRDTIPIEFERMNFMPVFSGPEGLKGLALRREAERAASPRMQKIYIESVKNDENMDSGSKHIAWQLRQRDKKYQPLSEFAAGQVIEAIRRFEGDEDPSGTYGRGLTRICAILDLDLGDLIKSRGSVEEMLRMIRAKVK